MTDPVAKQNDDLELTSWVIVANDDDSILCFVTTLDGKMPTRSTVTEEIGRFRRSWRAIPLPGLDYMTLRFSESALESASAASVLQTANGRIRDASIPRRSGR